MTIYPDAINVVKVQRRISEFTIPDEFASRVTAYMSRRGERERERGFGSGGNIRERKPLFWQDDKYESKVIFAARYIG